MEHQAAYGGGRAELLGNRHEAVIPIQNLDSVWRDLAQEDANRAHTVIWSLVASPRQTVDFFKERLRPASPADPKRLEERIAELDNDRFAVRQHAMQELGSLGELAEATLRQKLQERLTLEMRQRVEQLLRKVETSRSPDRFREVRGIEVLEHIGTSEAEQLLQTLAQGAPEARLTQEAKASLERLAKRPLGGR